MRAARLLAVGAICVFGAAGCRGGESDSAQVGHVVKDYDAALADGDSVKACSLLSEQAQEKVAQRHGYGGTLGVDATKTKATCADGIENRYPGDEAAIQELKFAPISDVEVRGDEAQVAIKLSGYAPTTASLAKEGGDWKLSSPPFP